MDQKKRSELEKEAQAKIAEAWKLIGEAGKLAKEGQFVLEFGEVGTFIPKRYKDPELYREEALEILKTEGRRGDWNSDKREYELTPYDQLSDEEKEEALEETIEGLIESCEVPWEFREYDGGEGIDDWWHPSRC